MLKGRGKPKLQDRTCSGIDLSILDEKELQQIDKLELKYIIDFYRSMSDQKSFFNNYFNILAGNTTLKQQIVNGVNESEIRASWAFDLEKFKKIREKYLLYEDFEARIQVK